MARLISKVYGDALFATAYEKSSIDTVYEEILFLKQVFEQNSVLKRFLTLLR